mmetsp:Transcript_8631/g.17944  ORF Transcript_8631/g.17944 Transcript_8631/m.17944 type:complete len:216 (-) Transcript_8631:2226-2873(-)
MVRSTRNNLVGTPFYEVVLQFFLGTIRGTGDTSFLEHGRVFGGIIKVLGRVTFLIFECGIGTIGQQKVHQGGMVRQGFLNQRTGTTIILVLRGGCILFIFDILGVSFHQGFDLGFAIVGKHECGMTIGILRIHIASRRDQSTNNGQMTPRGGRHQGGSSIRVIDIDTRAGLDEQIHHCIMSFRRRSYQWCDAFFTAIIQKCCTFSCATIGGMGFN